MNNLKDIIKNSQETIRIVNKVNMDKRVSYEKGIELRKAREAAKNRIYFARNLLKVMKEAQ